MKMENYYANQAYFDKIRINKSQIPKYELEFGILNFSIYLTKFTLYALIMPYKIHRNQILKPEFYGLL